MRSTYHAGRCATSAMPKDLDVPPNVLPVRPVALYLRDDIAHGQVSRALALLLLRAAASFGVRTGSEVKTPPA
jgi:hypothetical protein